MAKDSSYHDYLTRDVFSRIGGITSRAMFGGYGFYKQGVIFGMIADGTLYFKVGESNRADYEKAGSKPFVYEGGKKAITMPFWEVPSELIEDVETLTQWIAKSVDASIASKKKKRK